MEKQINFWFWLNFLSVNKKYQSLDVNKIFCIKIQAAQEPYTVGFISQQFANDYKRNKIGRYVWFGGLIYLTSVFLKNSSTHKNKLLQIKILYLTDNFTLFIVFSIVLIRTRSKNQHLSNHVSNPKLITDGIKCQGFVENL